MFKYIPTVNKFLCFTLETGGLAISCFLLCVLFIVDLILNYSLIQSILNCGNSNDTVSNHGKGRIKDLTETVDTSDKNDCFTTVSNISTALLALFLFVLIIFCLLCIKGTKERNHRLIKPLMLWEGIFTITSVISILSNPLNGIVSAILNAYMFVILHSLHSKLKAEHEGDNDEVVELPELPDLDLKEKH